MIKRAAFFRQINFLKLVRNSKICTKKTFILKYLATYSFIDVSYELRSYERGVAQLGSAGALGALGRRFESCRPDS